MDLYKEELLYYYKNQPHKGHINGANWIGKSVNYSCGDEIELELLVDRSGIIRDIGYLHDGCIVSASVMSMMAERLMGKRFDDIKYLDENAWLSEIGIDLTGSRKKCALVGYLALKNVKQK